MVASFAAGGFGDGYLSFATSGVLELTDPYPFLPDVRLSQGFNVFSPLSDEWSLFFSGDASEFFRPVGRELRFVYAADFAVSFRSGDFFFKAGLQSSGGQCYAEAPSIPDVFDNTLALQFSYDIGDTTLFFNPAISYKKEDLREDNVDLSGELGLTFLFAERLVATAKAGGSLTVVPLHNTTCSGLCAFDFSWYPDAPVVIVFSLGARLTDSDYSEPAAGDTVEPYDCAAFSFSAGITLSLSDGVLLEGLLPVDFNLKKMNAIRNGAFIGEPEWTLEFAPRIALSFVLTKGNTLGITLAGRPFLSNSDYHDVGFAELTISYQFDF